MGWFIYLSTCIQQINQSLKCGGVMKNDNYLEWLFVFIFNHAVIAVVQSLRIYESFGRLQELQMLNSWWIRKYFWTNWRSIRTNDNYAIHKKLETATVCQYRSSSGSVTVSSYKMIGAPSHSYFSRNLLMHEEISP